MKKLILLSMLFILASCGYRKKIEIEKNYATFEPEYKIWIYKDLSLITKFSITIDKANKKKIDSLNLVADKYIEKLNQLEK